MRKISNQFYRPRKALLIVSALSGLLFFMSVSSAVHAVNENTRNLPDYILDQMRQLNQIPSNGGRSNNNTCNGYNNAGWSWISPNRNSQITEVLDENPIDITQGDDGDATQQLRLNLVGAYCNSIINNSTGRISDTKLDTTKYRVVSSPLITIVDRNDASVANPGLSTSGLTANDDITLSYAQAIARNNRYAKGATASTIDIPAFQAFNLNGLDKLKSGSFTITIRVPIKRVNYFPGGYRKNANTPTFTHACVENGGETGGGSYNEAFSNCSTGYLYARLKINVQPGYNARCEVKRVDGIVTSSAGTPTNNPVYLSPGQSFKAVFAVRNTGTEAWKLVRSNPDVAENLFRLGSQEPRDNKRWGPQRVAITGRPQDFGGAALAGGALSPDFEVEFKVPDDLSVGTYPFAWQVIHDGAGGAKLGWIGQSCGSDINIRVQQPFLRVSGGDVVSGALFNDGDALTCSAPVDNKAYSANIKTNGIWGDGTGDDPLNGSSSGQYAVFSSGEISSSQSGSFLGNNVITREGRKDLLFANTGDAGYGMFNGPGSTSCVDLQPYVSQSGVEVTSSTTLAQALAGNASDTFTYSGQQELELGNLQVGEGSKVVVINSDLKISGDISYKPADSLEETPNLTVIVRGNIYIQANVGQMEGTYIAASNADNGKGLIDTCATISKGTLPNSGTGLSLGDSCYEKQLIVGGRLIARNILLKRIRGTVGSRDTVLWNNRDGRPSSCFVYVEDNRLPPAPEKNANGDYSNVVPRLEDCSAELIDFSPQAYFNDPLGPSNTTIGNVPISSKDLPPVY